MKIVVAGAGSFGMALASVLCENGHNVTLWTKNKNTEELLKTTRKNDKYLKDFLLDEKIEISSDYVSSFSDKEVIVISVPSHAVREVLTDIKPYINDNQKIINSAKGFDAEKGIRLSEVIEEILPTNRYAIFSGPSHAELIVQKKATAVVASAKDKEIALLVQYMFMNEYLRVYTSSDMLGVELGGALKNVIAIGVGILEGAKIGDNAKAAFMTRGNLEIAKLGEAMGAETLTFWGLSGVGDLIVTCDSKYSRNRRCGILLGEGVSIDDAIKEVGMVVEGVTTAKAAYSLCKKYDVDAPIIKEVYNVIYEGKSTSASLKDLMRRDRKDEFDFI